MSTPPPIGSRWRAKGGRGVWTVRKVGRRYVYLRSSVPGVPETLVDLVMWPGGWRPA